MLKCWDESRPEGGKNSRDVCLSPALSRDVGTSNEPCNLSVPSFHDLQIQGDNNTRPASSWGWRWSAKWDNRPANAQQTMRVCRMMVLANTGPTIWKSPRASRALLSMIFSSGWAFLEGHGRPWFLPLSHTQRASRQTLSISSGGRPGAVPQAAATHMEEGSLHSTAGPERLPGWGQGLRLTEPELIVYEFQEFINNELSILRLLESQRHLNVSGTRLRTWGFRMQAALQGCAGRAQGRAALTCIRTDTRPWAWKSRGCHYVLETANLTSRTPNYW